jgi:hypothetical protein
MKRMMDASEIAAWLTVSGRAQGEITRNGSRGPRPQRPFTGLPFTPGSGVPIPHLPDPSS